MRERAREREREREREIERERERVCVTEASVQETEHGVLIVPTTASDD